MFVCVCERKYGLKMDKYCIPYKSIVQNFD